MTTFIEESKPLDADTLLHQFIAEPSVEEIAQRATVNGGNPSLARRELILKTQADAKRIAAVSFTVISKLESEREVVMTATANYKRIVRSSTDALNQLEGALRQRADLLQELEETETSLDAAKKKLDSPDSLSVAPNELAMLQQRVKILPQQITSLKEQTASLSKKILSDAAAGEFDVPSIVRQMAAANRDSRGRIHDGQFQRHFDGGRLSLP